MVAEEKLAFVVCLGPNCSVNGAQDLIQWGKDLQDAGLLRLSTVNCTGNCTEAPVALFGNRYVTQASPAKLTETVIKHGWFV